MGACANVLVTEIKTLACACHCFLIFALAQRHASSLESLSGAKCLSPQLKKHMVHLPYSLSIIAFYKHVQARKCLIPFKFHII